MAAKIQITSTINSAQYKRGIKEMQGANNKFGKETSKIQGLIKKAFAVAAVVGFIKVVANATMKLINFGSKLTDLAAQSDLSVEKLQQYDLAVREAGGQTAQLTNALIQLKAKQGDTLSGNKEYLQSFQTLGITMQDLARMNTEEIFEKVAKSLTESGNGVKEYNAALELLGKRGGGKLIEALNIIGSSAGMAGKELNALSTEDAQTLDLIADKWANFKNSLTVTFARGVSNIFGGRLQKEVDERLRAQERSQALAKSSRQEALKQLRITEAQKDLEEKRAEVAKQLEKRSKRKKEIEEGMRDIEQRIKLEIDSDRFREIGGIVGNMVSESLKQERRILMVQEEQKKFLQQIEENTREGGGLG